MIHDPIHCFFSDCTTTMKGSSILSLRAWSKLNPPLPRTPRESQQLLNALTSSFRRQLDQEYPLPSSSENTENGDKPVNPDSSAHATDRHLNTILDNPLFKVVPSRGTISHDPSGAAALEQQRRMVETPMAVFDDLVASGSVNSTALANCLKSQLLLASTPSGTDVSTAMKASGAGSKVVSWFWASDSAARKMLLSSRSLTGSLLKFMAAEGMQDTVITWLGMLLKHDVGGRDGRLTESSARQSFCHLLIDFMAAEIQYGNRLASAMKYYLQAYKMHSLLADQSSPEFKKPLLLSPGGRLCQWTMEHAHGQARDIPAPIYEEFRERIYAMSPGSLLSASVPLYHPTAPDTGLLLKFVEGHPPEKCRAWSNVKQETLLRVSFDALRILVDRDESRKASRLAQYIQQLLPNETDLETTPKKYHTSPEEEYLLSRLDVAFAL